jgi:hypothetical protein
MTSIRSAVGFPELVNEKAARTVAAGVATLGLLTLLTGWDALVVVLAVGFALRVASGPRFSPLGLLATRVVAPRLGEPRIVPGPPKRFAQAVGLTLTTVAAVAGLGFGLGAVQDGLVAVLVAFASLESVVGFCAGCWVFGYLIRVGLVPEQTCAACADISLRRPAGVAA